VLGERKPSVLLLQVRQSVRSADMKAFSKLLLQEDCICKYEVRCFVHRVQQANVQCGDNARCSYAQCSSPPGLKLDFCSRCSKVAYCCKSCQALDWKTSHKHDCMDCHID
jgi:hypothetical protein